MPRFSRNMSVRMSIVTMVAALLFTYRWNIYRGAKHYYRIYVEGIQPPVERSMAEQEKINKVFERYGENAFGIDISHYQNTIDWEAVKYVGDSIPISFAILRASMGTNKPDVEFKRNWKEAKEQGLVRGAYHYYRPNEPSIKQAQNFIQRVDLKAGDLPPILDIEALPDVQSMDSLRLGLKRWLNKVETHYGIKPIIYTGDHYFRAYLDNEQFNTYPIWIANYNPISKPRIDTWAIWQFSEAGVVQGIGTHVDLNVLNGGPQALASMLIPADPP